MADEGLAWFENVLGAASKEEQGDISDARCPKCNAADFIKVADLYAESVGQLEEQPDGSTPVGIRDLTVGHVVKKFAPPRPKSALAVAIGVAIPLAALAYYVYRRFGDIAGQSTGVAAFVITVVVLMTLARRFSDQHYHARRQWNRLFMCRQCGQVIRS